MATDTKGGHIREESSFEKARSRKLDTKIRRKVTQHRRGQTSMEEKATARWAFQVRDKKGINYLTGLLGGGQLAGGGLGLREKVIRAQH